jgi:hypothetical protein
MPPIIEPQLELFRAIKALAANCLFRQTPPPDPVPGHPGFHGRADRPEARGQIILSLMAAS